MGVRRLDAAGYRRLGDDPNLSLIVEPMSIQRRPNAALPTHSFFCRNEKEGALSSAALFVRLSCPEPSAFIT